MSKKSPNRMNTLVFQDQPAEVLVDQFYAMKTAKELYEEVHEGASLHVSKVWHSFIFSPYGHFHLLGMQPPSDV